MPFLIAGTAYLVCPDRTSGNFTVCEDTIGIFGIAGHFCCDGTLNCSFNLLRIEWGLKIFVSEHAASILSQGCRRKMDAVLFNWVPVWYPSVRRTQFTTVSVTAGMGFSMSPSTKPSSFLAKLHVTGGIISFAVETVGRHRSNSLLFSEQGSDIEQMAML